MGAIGLALGGAVPLPHGGDPGFGRYLLVPACVLGPLILLRPEDSRDERAHFIVVGLGTLWLGWTLRLLWAMSLAAKGIGALTVPFAVPVFGLLAFLVVLALGGPLIVCGAIATRSLHASMPLLRASGTARLLGLGLLVVSSSLVSAAVMFQWTIMQS